MPVAYASVVTGPVLGVGVVVVHDGRLLMVQRGNEPARGLWSVPGGRVRPGESLSEAVRREVKEETSLDIEVGDLLGVLEIPGDTHFVVLDYLGSVARSGALAAGGDAAQARWVPLGEVAKLPCTPRFVETMRGWGVLT